MTRCLSPLLSSFTGLSARCHVFVSSMAFLAMAMSFSLSIWNRLRWGLRPIRTMSNAVKLKAITVSCGTTAICFATSTLFRAYISISFRKINPLCGLSVLLMLLSKVVFPDPLGPRMPTKSRSFTEKRTFSKTLTDP